MKKSLKKSFCVFAALLISILICVPFGAVKAKAATELDYIEDFTVYVTPLDDATLNMCYVIKWRVLNSTSDGPLEWVKIGIPNRFVDKLSAGGDVKKVKYYSDGGAFMRADLKRNFYRGETANIEFSFHLSRMFTLKQSNDGETVEFGFYPGWFDEIRVGKVTVNWQKLQSSDVVYTDGADSGDYYSWTAENLACGEKMPPCKIKYTRASFPEMNPKKSYSSSYMRFIDVLPIMLFCIGFVGIIAVIIAIPYFRNNGYAAYRGFYGGVYTPVRRFFWFIPHRGVNRKGKKYDLPVDSDGFHHGGGGGSSGGGCACACACACAGGGRAGCSRKDFYSPNADEFVKVLKREEKQNKTENKKSGGNISDEK